MGFATPLPGDVRRGAVNGLVEPHLAAQAAEGSMPMEPARMAASSERMSPKVFSVTRVSKWVGLWTSAIAQLSTRTCSTCTSGYSLATPVHGVPPELGHDEDIGLVHRGQPLLPLHRHVEGGAHDPLDFTRRVGHGVHRALAAAGQRLAAARLAEVEAAGELADHHEVRPLHHRALERRGVHQHRKALRGAQVGEEVQLLADAEEAALRPRLLREVVPLGPAHRAEEDGVGLLAEPEGGVRQGPAGGVDGGAAHEARLELERRPVALPTTSRARRASGVTSWPIPSPGRNAILCTLTRGLLVELVRVPGRLLQPAPRPSRRRAHRGRVGPLRR